MNFWVKQSPFRAVEFRSLSMPFFKRLLLHQIFYIVPSILYACLIIFFAIRWQIFLIRKHIIIRTSIYMDKSSKEVADVFSNYTIDQLNGLVLRMRAYAKQKLGDYADNHEGQQKLDFVFNVFQKALTDIRKWDEDKCDFENFLFGVLKSEISAYHEKAKRRKPPEEEDGSDESYILDIQVYSEEVGHDDLSFDEIDNKKLKENYVTLLKDSGTSDLEMLIFECWCENIYKPSNIADFLEVDTTEVYNAIKRLERRKSKLNSQVK